jgi:hypothetical protein
MLKATELGGNLDPATLKMGYMAYEDEHVD